MEPRSNRQQPHVCSKAGARREGVCLCGGGLGPAQPFAEPPSSKPGRSQLPSPLRLASPESCGSPCHPTAGPYSPLHFNCTLKSFLACLGFSFLISTFSCYSTANDLDFHSPAKPWSLSELAFSMWVFPTSLLFPVRNSTFLPREQLLAFICEGSKLSSFCSQ